MLIFSGHQPIMGKFLSTEDDETPSSCSCASEANTHSIRHHSKNDLFLVFSCTENM
jgi:hypothetical protein